MHTFSYADLHINAQNGRVYLTHPDATDPLPTPLQLCEFEGQGLLVIGSSRSAEFYDAEEIVRGLLGAADEFNLPLPKPIDCPALDNIPLTGKSFFWNSAMGQRIEYLKTLVGSHAAGQAILDEAKEAGIYIKSAQRVAELVQSTQEQVAKDIRSRLLQDKVQDATSDYRAPMPHEETPADRPFMVIGKAPANKLARMERSRGGYSEQSMRIKWPFKEMSENDDVLIPPNLAKRAQTAVHVYAARTGKRFSTETKRGTGVLTVTRLKDQPSR
jgi:hypothetical protein